MLLNQGLWTNSIPTLKQNSVVNFGHENLAITCNAELNVWDNKRPHMNCPKTWKARKKQLQPQHCEAHALQNRRVEHVSHMDIAEAPRQELSFRGNWEPLKHRLLHRPILHNPARHLSCHERCPLEERFFGQAFIMEIVQEDMQWYCSLVASLIRQMLPASKHVWTQPTISRQQTWIQSDNKTCHRFSCPLEWVCACFCIAIQACHIPSVRQWWDTLKNTYK